ncbi:rho GTPase-activating protein [Plakobranchus ocellatus]|uniref:Rho GTPase-activating protein n=1 Tax=Plakobranchus ocellatus TaxID=259542 RepID=A0AAV3Z9A1_9GAST|nr:rho GTPase-activating protein [Plakobranchus ocellatus]
MKLVNWFQHFLPPQIWSFAALYNAVKRIPDYARYLNDLLQETDPSHPDYEDLNRAAGRVTSMVKEREHALSESDHHSAMDAVQERFPKDDLHLHDSPTAPHSTTAAAASTTHSNTGTDDSIDSSPAPSAAQNTPTTAPKVDDSGRQKNGNDLGSGSPLLAVELKKDKKANGSNNSSGNSSPSAMNRTSKNNNNNNKNNNEDKEAISVSFRGIPYLYLSDDSMPYNITILSLKRASKIDFYETKLSFQLSTV